MKILHSRGQNYLLSELYAIEFDRLLPYLEAVLLTHDDILFHPNTKMDYAYFPTTAIISINSILGDGSTVEVASVGNEGMLGIPIFLGGGLSRTRAVVRVTGRAYRIAAPPLLEEFYREGPLLRLLLCYTQSMMDQLGQRVVCNGHHSAEQRLCTFIMQMIDRTFSMEFAITQEELGRVLGVRRETVTDAAIRVQDLGMIKYRRGHITVLNRTGVASLCCECYQSIADDTARLLPNRHAARHIVN